MWQRQLNSIKEHILQYNPYLTQGFNHAWQDEQNGEVYAQKGKEFVAVFPNDSLGDYFYLRTPQKVSFSESKEFVISDCYKGTGMIGQVVLVAMVRDADADGLLNNLINTVQLYDNETIALNSAVYQNEFVVIQELAKMSKEAMEAALARIKPNMTMVSITFTIKAPFRYRKLSCMTKPCKPC